MNRKETHCIRLVVVLLLMVLATVAQAGTFEQRTTDATWVGYTGADPLGPIATTPHWNDSLLEVQSGITNTSRSQRVLVRWDLSSLTSVTSVQNATLTMHVSQAGKASIAQLAAYSVSAGNHWATDQATYHQRDVTGAKWQPTGTRGASAGGSVTYPGNWLNGPVDATNYTVGSNYYITFDVTDIVLDWLINGVENNGFALGLSQYVSSSTDYVHFSNPNQASTPIGNHPLLQIEYTDEGISTLKPMHLQTSLGVPGSPQASIVASAEFTSLAATLQSDIHSATGITLPIVTDTTALGGLNAYGNLILLGYYGHNRVIDYFYNRWYLVVDGAQPGVGGHVLQTVHNPDNLSINLIVVGGSDTDGVATAAARLVDEIATYGATLPRLFTVQMGAGANQVNYRGSQVMDPAREWPTIHAMEAQKAIAEVGMLYLYTGQPQYLDKYREKLIEWLTPGVYTNWSDDFYRLIITWDLLEETPVFTDPDRLWITTRFWQALEFFHTNQEINYTNFMAVKDLWELRANHQTRFANTSYFGSRYFNQYYGMSQTDFWLDNVNTFWLPQMTSFAVKEGTTNIAHISLTDALTYALAEDNSDFLSTDVLGMIAQKGLMLTSGPSYMGGSEGYSPFLFWCLSERRFDDNSYLWLLYVRDSSLTDVRLPWMVSWELGRSFWDGTIPAPAGADGDWVMKMPLAELYYNDAQSYGPVNVSLQDSFDFLVFKDPCGLGRQYLSLDGHNTGSYSTDSANSFTAFATDGIAWLGGSGRVATVRKHSSLAITKDGADQALPAFAQLLRAENSQHWGISRTALLDHNGTDWYRNIISIPNRWFLVVDEVVANESRDFVMETRWRSYAHGGFDGADFICIQQDQGVDLEFRLTGYGWDSQYLSPWLYSDYLHSPRHSFPKQAAEIDAAAPLYYWLNLSRRWAGYLESNERHVFAHLCCVHPQNTPVPYELTKLDELRYQVAGDGAYWLAEDSGAGQWTVQEVTVPAEPTSVESTVPDTLPPLPKTWESSENHRILSSASVSEGATSLWAVGLDNGTVRLRNQLGQVVSGMTVPGMVFALVAVDLDGDNNDEVIAGSDTGGVRAFLNDGTELWTWTPPPWEPNPSWRQSFGVPRTVITQLAEIDIEPDGVPEILAAGLYYYVLDNNGNLICTYDTVGELDFTDLVGVNRTGLWRTLETEIIVSAADVNGDNAPEVFGDVADRSYRYVRAWNAANGERSIGYNEPSDRYLGSAIKKLASGDIDGDNKDELVVGYDAFLDQLVVYGYPEGIIWHESVGSAVEALLCADLTNNNRADIIVGTEMGHVQTFDGGGNRLWLSDIGAAVTSLVFVTSQGEKQIWAGTADGAIVVLDEGGSKLRADGLPTLVDHLTVDASHEWVLATTAEGSIALYEVHPPCWYTRRADLNKDCYVDLDDFALFTHDWDRSGEPNLVARYAFDDPMDLLADSARSSVDHSMTVTEGAISSSADVYDEVLGSSALFDGGSSAAFTPVPINDPLRSPHISVAFWMKHDADAPLNSYVIAWTDPAIANGTENTPWACYVYADSDLVWRMNSAAGEWRYLGNNHVQPGTWRHWTIAHGDNESYLYVNGAEVGSFIAGTNGIIQTDLDPTDLILGTRSIDPGDGGNVFYRGLLDDVQIYDRTLSAHEARWLYLNPGQTLSALDPWHGDLNADGAIDLEDIGLFFSDWLECTVPVTVDCDEY